MEKYIFDKDNGLWYERQGDYYIPCLSLPGGRRTAHRSVGSAAFAVHQGVPQGPLHQLTVERQSKQLFGRS